MNHRIVLYALAVVAVAGLFLPLAGDINLAGLTNFDELGLTEGLEVDGTNVIDASGNWVGAINTASNNLTVGSNGSALDALVCGTSTWNPASVSSSTAPDSLDISVSGAALGDPVVVSFDSATTTDQWNVAGKVTGSGTSTIYLRGIAGAAVNLSTSTARACTLQFN